jgi:hypothetical protein
MAEGRPEATRYVQLGGGSGCSTDDDGEGNEPAGGKAPTERELG